MIRIILSGCNGQMGRKITEVVSARDDCAIVCGVDVVGNARSGYPVVSFFEDITVDADVIIDFSHTCVLSSLLAYATERKIPAVLCTTGYSESQMNEIHEASQHIPVFYSRNMSLGINLLIALAQKAAGILGGSFDIEIVEKHHNQKIDAPSGTALMIADAICKETDTPYNYEYDRHSKRAKRTKEEIGIHSVRGGTIVGEHEVIFAGNNEVITISHSAQSKTVFASGAVNAAKFIVGKEKGLYDMESLVSQ
ncbi:MAG: 4-hydroxy-tetrahydrodipicolinate reductase [Clostridia bacterium]|nr:4-hydroxy-tetrahydrodipicolinate reductase [Clostridia bacterium]